MELKLLDNCMGSGTTARVNRTFMELKYSKEMSIQDEGERVNRTFMELKSLFCKCGWFLLNGLIVPLWN